MTYKASINIMIEVTFEDNGEDDITDQAMEIAAMAYCVNGDGVELLGHELVGQVEKLPDTPAPAPAPEGDG